MSMHSGAKKAFLRLHLIKSPVKKKKARQWIREPHVSILTSPIFCSSKFSDLSWVRCWERRRRIGIVRKNLHQQILKKKPGMCSASANETAERSVTVSNNWTNPVWSKIFSYKRIFLYCWWFSWLSKSACRACRTDDDQLRAVNLQAVFDRLSEISDTFQCVTASLLQYTGNISVPVSISTLIMILIINLSVFWGICLVCTLWICTWLTFNFSFCSLYICTLPSLYYSWCTISPVGINKVFNSFLFWQL